MPTPQIFENAYPFVFKEDKENDLELDEIKIPAQNIIARLNDQWVEEIGLDSSKFGYGSTLKGLLASKVGERPRKQNLIEKIKILQTIGLVFPKLSDNAKDEVMDFIEQEMILYPNLKGSRDQTYFHHKKQLTVILLDLLNHVTNTKYEKSILDLLYDILEDNFAVVSHKTYFDEYNSYTYSEEQRNIANTIVTGVEKKLISLLDNISHHLKLDLMRRLWAFPLLHNDDSLKKMIVNKVHIGNKKFDLSSIQELIKKLEKESAPELDILKEIIIDQDVVNEKDLRPDELLKFYSSNLSSDDKESKLSKVIKNIKKLFKDTKTLDEKVSMVKHLMTPNRSIESMLDDDATKEDQNILAIADLFIDDEDSRNIIIDVLIENHSEKRLFEKIASQLKNNTNKFEEFKLQLTDSINHRSNSKLDEDLKDKFSDFIIQINSHDFLHEDEGKKFINLLLEKRDDCTVCDSILEKLFLKGADTNLGRYLQYILYTRNKK